MTNQKDKSRRRQRRHFSLNPFYYVGMFWDFLLKPTWRRRYDKFDRR